MPPWHRTDLDVTRRRRNGKPLLKQANKGPDGERTDVDAGSLLVAVFAARMVAWMT